MIKFLRPVLILNFILFTFPISAQIKIKELHGLTVPGTHQEFFGSSETRKIIDISSGWKAYLPDNDETGTEVSLPAAFSGTDEMIFEREIDTSKFDFNNSLVKLHIAKINYSANILINDEVIYKHPFGEIPASFELNKSLFLPNQKNKLKIRVSYNLDSESSIPVKQDYLMPENTAGIYSNVYISVEPLFKLGKQSTKFEFSSRYNRADVQSYVSVAVPETFDEKAEKESRYVIKFMLYNNLNEVIDSSKTRPIKLEAGKTIKSQLSFRISEPEFWSLAKPYQYLQKFSFYRNDTLIDEYSSKLILSDIKAKNGAVTVNGETVKIYAVKYYQKNAEHLQITNYEDLLNDLKIIKNAGFNTVIFTYVPEPVALQVCEETGLLCIIDLPLNSVPEFITSNDNFREKTTRYISQIITGFNSKILIGFGLGSGYLANSAKHIDFVQKNSALIKKKSGKLTYASFLGIPNDTIPGLDLTGIEIFSKSFEGFKSRIAQAEKILGKDKIILGPYTYPVYKGGTNGYKNSFSFEAQARNFENALDFVKNEDLKGIIFNSMFDYKLNFPSLATGFNKENICFTGILGEDRNTNRLSYNILKSKLRNGEKINIPIGTGSDDAPLFFIIVCVGISLLTALLINSKRKFREDASRALLRPYNFYADVRDQRILSGFHSNILLILITGSLSLLLTNFLFYLKTNILLDKLLISFGSVSFVEFIGRLSNDPVRAFIYFFILSLLFIVSISVFIKIASLFVKNRVLLSSVYYTVTWSFLPMLLMLPVEIALYKILSANEYNLYIYIVVGFFFFWLFQRLVKGIYVIFDIHPFRAYLFSILFIFFSWGFVFLYFQFTESSIYYIINAFKQFALMQ